MKTKLIKIGKVYHARIKTTSGATQTITTRSTNRVEAERIARDAGIPQIEAAAKSGRLTREVIGRVLTDKKLTMQKAMAEYADWQKAVGKSDRTIENNAAIYRTWLAFDKPIATTPPAAITEKDINKFINRQDTRAGAVSRKVMLAAMRSLFDFCSAKGWTIGNPAQLVAVNYDLLSHAQKETDPVEPYTEAEYRKIIAHLRDEIADCEKEVERYRGPGRTAANTPRLSEWADRLENRRFWLAAVELDWETGMRIGDVARLEWDCFKMPGKVIVWTGKRNKRVAVPISKDLATLITEIPPISGNYVFPDQRVVHMDPKRRSLLSVQFNRIAEKAGIDKSFHSLRHAFVTRMKKAGKTLEDIGELVGHTRTKTTERYIH